jgi:hypothetical protein
MSEDKTMKTDQETTKEEPVVITYNGTEYRQSDLTEEQMALASRLNVIGRKLATLQAAHDDYVMTNDYKNIVIQSFERSINPEVVEEDKEE